MTIRRKYKYTDCGRHVCYRRQFLSSLFFRIFFSLCCRKSQLLAGSNIYITEDFSKRVKDRRMELQKFMKKLKRRWRVCSRGCWSRCWIASPGICSRPCKNKIEKKLMTETHAKIVCLRFNSTLYIPEGLVLSLTTAEIWKKIAFKRLEGMPIIRFFPAYVISWRFLLKRAMLRLKN